MTIIDVEGLQKSYGETVALKNINLKIEAGGIVGLLGPNGAGKTTLMETLQGLRTATAGKISVMGMDPSRQAHALREQIGVQLQATAIPPDLTPIETLRLFASFFAKSLPPKEVLERVQLTDKAKARNSMLSGGQRQRLAIAMALINDPSLVILDEPTTGLDPAARREIYSHILDMKTAGKTVLLSTQHMEEAEKLCDRVVVLREGEIVADGSPLALVSRTAHVPVLSIVLEGDFDATPLLQAGTISDGRTGNQQRFLAHDPKAALKALAALLQNLNITLADLQMKRPDLEDVYLELVAAATSKHGAIA